MHPRITLENQQYEEEKKQKQKRTLGRCDSSAWTPACTYDRHLSRDLVTWLLNKTPRVDET